MTVLRTCEEHVGSIVVYTLNDSCPACYAEDEAKENKNKLDSAQDEIQDLIVDNKSKQLSIDELMETLASYKDRL